jgi:hypothetical protein
MMPYSKQPYMSSVFLKGTSVRRMWFENYVKLPLYTPSKYMEGAEV